MSTNIVSRIFGRKAPNVNPNPATSLSQKAQILADLQKGKAITPMDALNDYGCFRLGARIADLKNEGWPIASKYVTTPSGKRVKSYFFESLEVRS